MEVLTKDNFSALVEQGTKPVLCEFWAPWCGYCRRLGPAYDQLAGELGEKVVFCKLNIDDEPELAGRFGVMSIPTVIFFKDGEEIDRKVGVMPADSFTAVLDANL